MEEKELTRPDAEALIQLPLAELVFKADRIRKRYHGLKIELCGITNARSGLCSEDCKFCAQSSRYATGVSVYPLKEKSRMLDEAKGARDEGAVKFGIVTSGKRVNGRELAIIAGTVEEIRNKAGIDVCCSLGALSKKELSALKDAGLTRYHHNLETSRSFYPRVVTTHTIEERITTVGNAKEAGLEVCSGGIIGLGESWRDRIEMAFMLRELDVDSVPLNALIPIEGTPLESRPRLSAAEVLKTICLFRILLPDKLIKIAAGREVILGDFQGLAFLAGANGMLIGGYLTVPGRNPEDDMRLVEEVEKLWNG